MPEQTTGGADAGPALRSLAGKVNWLIDRARPAGRGSCSNAEVADLIERTTGERVSDTTIWKLRNGQAANPQMKLIEAMARPFGVPPGFFFADYDTGQAGLLHEEAEVPALVRSASISPARLRPILGLSPAARQAVIDLIAAVTAARGPRGGPPVVGGLASAQGLPGAQPRPLPVARRRDLR